MGIATEYNDQGMTNLGGMNRIPTPRIIAGAIWMQTGINHAALL
jgi:hypothetical protein